MQSLLKYHLFANRVDDASDRVHAIRSIAKAPLVGSSDDAMLVYEPIIRKLFAS